MPARISIIAVALFFGSGAFAATENLSASITEYPLPRPNAFPHDPAVGSDGVV